MQIFLDTANITDITKYNEWGLVDGVTTNPTLIAKEGADPKKRILEICKTVDGPVSMECVAEDAEGLIKQARFVAKWHENVFAKIPLTPEGLKAVKTLSAEGINTNVTLCFSVTQALLAAKAGATLVSPFVGRVDDIAYDGIALIQEIVSAFELYGYQTKVLAASLRHTRHIVDCIHAGADIITIPPKLMDKMVAHPLTDKGLSRFMKDWNECDACQDIFKST